MGTAQGAKDTLLGSATVPDGTDPWAAKLLRHLEYHPKVAQGQRAKIDLSEERYAKAWKHSRERTSGGPSGIDFAHFRASTPKHYPAMHRFNSIMTAIPYETGFSPNSWQQGLNAMLEKKANKIEVDKLRAILLYEVDFNMNAKILGRDTMLFAEDLDTVRSRSARTEPRSPYTAVAKEQYGSRKEHSSQNQCLNKRLSWDIARQLKEPMAMCSNDAKSCYDRIVHNIASLSLQRVGVQESYIICMFTTIQNLEHRIRSVNGDSTLGFSGRLWAVPIGGVGQGNGAGPQIWALVSTPVLHMLRSEGLGAFFEASVSGDRLFFVGYSFVDDTDLVVKISRTSTTA